MQIKQLRCRVRVRTGTKTETPLHKEDKAPRPAMAFVLPQSSQTLEQSGGRTANEAREQDMITQEATRHIAAQGQRADPRMVADRVYDLMREEARLMRSRGGV